LQRAFHLGVLMVPSSTLIVAVEDDCLMCGGFSLGETIHLGSFEFITDYFDGLSLSPRRSNSGDAFMGSTHNGSPSPRQAMIEDSIKEFHTMSSGEGTPASPSPGGVAWGFCLLPSQPHYGECSDRSGHDDSPTADSGAMVRHRPPLRATVCSSGGQ
jgi:hypothetical protein